MTKYLNNPNKYSGDYYVDWIRDSIDTHWRGSGNMVVVRHHLIPVLEQIPTEWIEFVINSYNESYNDECLELLKNFVAERYLLGTP